MPITFSNKKSSVSASEAIELYVSVGWGNREDYDLTSTKNALKKSDFIVSARNKQGELVGLARVLSDGTFYTTIPDMVVNPKYQRKGIGTKMMKLIEKEYEGVPIFVETFKANIKILKKFGFEQKSNMIVFSKKNAKVKNRKSHRAT